jgi:hypothetical protein
MDALSLTETKAERGSSTSVLTRQGGIASRRDTVITALCYSCENVCAILRSVGISGITRNFR